MLKNHVYEKRGKSKKNTARICKKNRVRRIKIFESIVMPLCAQPWSWHLLDARKKIYRQIKCYSIPPLCTPVRCTMRKKCKRV